MNYNKIIKLVKETNKFIVRSEQLNLIKKKSEADFVTDVDIKISNFLKEKGKNCDFFPFFFSFTTSTTSSLSGSFRVLSVAFSSLVS